MAQATTSKLSKVFRCSQWLAGSGHLVNKWIMKGGWVRATRSVLRGVSIAERAMSLILLWPSVSYIYECAKREYGTYWSIGLYLWINTLVVSYIREHKLDGRTLFPKAFIQRRAGIT